MLIYTKMWKYIFQKKIHDVTTTQTQHASFAT